MDKMRKGLIVVGILVLLLVGLGVVFGGYYNSFVTKSKAVDNQWAQVETQYQRRFDLIPNLVAATKGTLKQEQKVFGEIAEARTRYSGAQTATEKVKATNQVESALARLLVIMENYPQLKSNETVQQLMAQLEGTENRVSVERRRYNEVATEYNISISRVPGVMFAGMFGFKERTLFKSEAGAEKAPKVDLGN
ncbi:LemA family protein [Candidatus Aquicultor secundus]|nr:LemA family protein [Candidatus Aquicultor secundus]